MNRVPIANLKPASPAEIEAQRAGMLNYTPGERQAQAVSEAKFKRRAYVSIDLETTGLDESFCQVIEFGAVIDDWVTPVDKLPRFHAYLVHDRIVGEAYALSMHAAILKRIGKAQEAMGDDVSITHGGYKFLRPHWLGAHFEGWLINSGIDTSKPVLAAGKNFAGFDRQFLSRVRDFNVRFIHRTIDPGMLFWQPERDDTPPSSKTCMERAGITGEVAHTAVEDAITVIRMVRFAKPYPVTPAAYAPVSLTLASGELILSDNGQIAYPADWEPIYNCKDPCDMLLGHCVCGASHNRRERANLLNRYSATVVEN